MGRLLPAFLLLTLISCAAFGAVGESADAERWNDLGIAHREAGRYTEAEAAFRQAISLNPAFVEAHNNLGRVYFKTGRYEAAIESFKKASELEPKAVGILNNLAEAYARAGSYGEAESAFKRALEIKPDDPQTRYGLGVLYIMKDDRASALEEYKLLRRLDPERARKLWDIILR